MKMINSISLKESLKYHLQLDNLKCIIDVKIYIRVEKGKMTLIREFQN